ncbi:MAG: stage II sporulation protein P [Clostridia bacterium]|jgi:stage II sporulation protein P|nr:stage II sporulation protein P [Clostridia bacterium]
MINMAVLNLKDIVKYLIKITLIIAIVIGLTKYFSTVKASVAKRAEGLEEVSFTSCLDVTIPGIASDKQDKQIEETKISPLEKMLYLNLGMLNSLNDKSLNKKEEDNKQTNETDQEAKQDIEEPLQKAETGLETEVQKNNVPEKYTSEYKGVKIRNETKYKLTEEILTPNVTVKKDNILIFHTHTCESYTPSEKYQYKQTGNYRTTDRNFSVVRVGRELDRQLQNYGYKVTHSETYHDYPSYTGSYENSYKTVTNLLQKNKNTDIVIDLHRDAISDYSYAPTVKIGEEYAAQLMFVIGGNISKEHPNWQQNLKFAVKIQQKANEMYPGLFKPIILRYASYNQQTAKGASIIEVGSTGNTMEQALTSMKYLAKVMDEVLKK